jgi:predicted PurR-regulated permease PerM
VRAIAHLASLDWASIVDQLERGVLSRLESLSDDLGLDLGSLHDGLIELAKRIASAATSVAASSAASLPDIVIALFLFLLATYYALKDGHAIADFLLRASPYSEEETRSLFAQIEGTVRGAILGSLVTALIQGTLTGIALAIFGVPSALLLGAVATIAALIPLVGTTPVTFGAVIYLASLGRIGPTIGMLVAALFIGVIDNLIRPVIQAAAGRMHPLAALIGIFGGISSMGFPGIFLGPVVVAIVLWALERRVASKPSG